MRALQRRAPLELQDGGSFLPGVLGTVLGALDGVTDIVAEALPPVLPRPVVGIAVKGGLALIVLGFAKSLLSVSGPRAFKASGRVLAHMPLCLSSSRQGPLARGLDGSSQP